MTLGVWDPSVALSLSQDELLNTETEFWVDMLQFTRAITQMQNYTEAEKQDGYI